MSDASSSSILIKKMALNMTKLVTVFGLLKENLTKSYFPTQWARMEGWLAVVDELSDQISECYLEESVDGNVIDADVSSE